MGAGRRDSSMQDDAASKLGERYRTRLVVAGAVGAGAALHSIHTEVRRVPGACVGRCCGRCSTKEEETES